MVRPALRLDESALGAIDERVEMPRYDRRRLHASIVHLGVGGFHRAHQAVYLDDLASLGADWGEYGIGLLPQDRLMAEALVPQQGLYTVLVRGPGPDRARVIGCMLTYLFAPDDPEAALSALADPSTRIVTMTVTEAGYNVDEVTGRFDASNRAVREDLLHPERPTTWFGYLAEALDRRRQAGIAPFTLLSCDNVQGNGTVTMSALSSFARLRDESLAAWIERHVACPNSMVDRITPQTADADRELVAREFGVVDRWPVVTEPFCQWVMEDAFGDGRPPLQEVGVQFVTDVHPYETMKLRLLNASHLALGVLGSLAGYRTVDQVMLDPVFCTFVQRQMTAEVAPLLAPVPGIDLDGYQRTLIERFSNPRIADQLARICLDGSAKIAKFLLPPLHDAIGSGRPHRCLTLSLAGWIRYLSGVDDQGQTIVVQDARAAELQALARAHGDDPRPLLARRDIFDDLIDCEPLVARLETALRDLRIAGSRATVGRSLAE